MEPAKKLSNRDFGAANAFVSLISSITKPDKEALKSQIPLGNQSFWSSLAVIEVGPASMGVGVEISSVPS